MEDKRPLKFVIIAMTAQGEGISGGDRISIEFARRWSKQHPVSIYLWEEGYRMYLRQKLDPKKINFNIVKVSKWKRFGFFVNYLATILSGINFALRINIENNKDTIVYSATEFWMDSLPGFILKLRFPKVTWVATWFQTAPNPLVGFKEGDRALSYRLYAFAYWFVQQPIKPLIKRYADFVLVNNEDERKQFPKMNKSQKVIVVIGAVDLSKIRQWVKKSTTTKKIYDGVFQGRFHPQKGVIELIDIWKEVVSKKPNAKLALIGDGPLMTDVIEKIKLEKLEKNIKLFGYVFDGSQKYKIFSSSKVVVHPAFFDSGGMASAEAMAFGLPAVGFNLVSYQSYYPKGMVKVPINNLTDFAGSIIKLLQNKKMYSKMRKEAKMMISKNWSWDKRSDEILNYLIST